MSPAPTAGSSVVPLPAVALELWLVDLDAMAEPLRAAEKSIARLSPHEHARARNMKDPTQSWRWLSAHIALRLLLERWGGAGLRTQPFQIDPGGRPTLPQSPAHFSLSHSGNHALIGLTRIAPLGVDIEVVAPRLMSAERRAHIVSFAQTISGGAALPGHLAHGDDGQASQGICDRADDAEDAAFIQAWCRVEAFAKADGRGVLAVLPKLSEKGTGQSSPAGAKSAGVQPELGADPGAKPRAQPDAEPNLSQQPSPGERLSPPRAAEWAPSIQASALATTGLDVRAARHPATGLAPGPDAGGARAAAYQLSGYRVWDVPLGSPSHGYRAAVALARAALISSDALYPRWLDDVEAASTPLMRQADFVLSPSDDGG